ncbi:MAG: hypothetical protein HUU08_04330 [Candidatus Brocadia sp.]|nr:hypothetical protein [Candidatus Brocadia sp.]
MVFVGQGIACQIKPGNTMQCEHGPPLPKSVPCQTVPAISLIPHPHELDEHGQTEFVRATHKTCLNKMEKLSP